MTWRKGIGWVLSTGRQVGAAHSDVIGIGGHEYGKLTAFEGYDGRIDPEDFCCGDEEHHAEDEQPFTAAERAEIADHMIAAWQRWKEASQ